MLRKLFWPKQQEEVTRDWKKICITRAFSFEIITKYYYDYHNQEDELGETCKRVKEKRNTCRILRRHLKKKKLERP
jgi:hypothetical protein